MRFGQYSYLKRQDTAISSVHFESVNWPNALMRLEGAYAANTIRSYRSDFLIFEMWCRQERLAALPATGKSVAEFIQAQAKTRSPATICRRQASIAKIHRLLDYPDPTNSEEVNLAARIVLRLKGRRQKQALGLANHLKAKLLDTCDNTLRGLRDKALISVGYDTLCRRSELVSLRIENIAKSQDASATVLIEKSKTDPLGHGRLAYLSKSTTIILENWLAAAKSNSGYLFRQVHGCRSMDTPLRPHSVARIIKERATKAKLDRDIIINLSGHSMRVGAAQDMAGAGISLPAIMLAGGWKSVEMVMRYIEHTDIQKSGMAQLYTNNAFADEN